MKKFATLLLIVCVGLFTSLSAQCVVGVEANGSDQATMEAYKWREANVYPYYASKGFKIVLISQSSAAKLEAALDANAVTHITGCGHGNSNVYTGYNQATVLISSNTALLKKLAGKQIHLLSCLTAQQLGPDMIKNGAAGYAGYYPSFYFTWKSTARFFDADAEMDRAFAEGLTPAKAYQRTIDKFNEIMKILQTEEPSAVQYIVIDRDGLRCMPQRGEVMEAESVLPLEYSNYVLFAMNPGTRGFLSFADCKAADVRSIDFSAMTPEEFKTLVVATYERCERDFELGILSVGKLSRDQIIAEILQNTEMGKSLVELQKNFLQIVAASRWSKTITVTTDAGGNIASSGTFDVPFAITVTGVKAAWKGEPGKFTNANVVLNNETVYNNEVANGVTYKFSKQVKSGPCQYAMKAAGGPKSAEISVTLYFDLGK